MKSVLDMAAQYNMLPQGCGVLAAVSGGADSMCLLVFLTENAEALGITVSAAHFNHLLRGRESDRDEDFVREFCESRKIPFFCGRGDVAAYSAENSIGTEEAARILRYDFLEKTRCKCGAEVIATAHNADDNAETILLNLTRGTGLAGLRGIPPVRGHIVRPLLTVTRMEIEEYLKMRGVSFVTDSTNLTDDYSRNKIRHSVLPVLRELNPRLSQSLSGTSALLRRDEDYLSQAAADFISRNASENKAPVGALCELHPAVSSRVIRALAGRELSSRHVSDILALCKSPSPSGRLNIPGMTVYREYDNIFFGGFVTGAFEKIVLSDVGRAVISPLNLEISISETIFDNNIHKTFTDYLFKTTDVYGKISIRPRIPGDKLRPVGCSFTKTIKKLMMEKHIPACKRDLVPVIADDMGALAVHNVSVGDRAVPSPGDRVYKITFKERV